MRFDQTKFFDGFKTRFDDSLDQSQVDGINSLLGNFEQSLLWSDVRHIAYAFATIFHETAGSMQPVEEGYYLGRYGQARVKSFQKSLRYYPYFGRGYVQLTWRTNYLKAGKALNLDLVNAPELALDEDAAFEVMSLGMHQGWFSAGNTLEKYIHGKTCDYAGARRIINGTDKAALIAGYAVQFEHILQDSLVSAAAVSVPESNNVELTPVNVDNSQLSPGTQAGPNESSPTPPPSADPVKVTPVKPSLWSIVMAVFTTAAGWYKIAKSDYGDIYNRAMDAIDIHFILNTLVGAALVALGVFTYNWSRNRASKTTTDLIARAADRAQNTVELK